jgi:hypothetical protein
VRPRLLSRQDIVPDLMQELLMLIHRASSSLLAKTHHAKAAKLRKLLFSAVTQVVHFGIP